MDDLQKASGNPSISTGFYADVKGIIAESRSAACQER
jgi:hypothetical protein